MKDLDISSCEKLFISKALKERKRLDGREFDQMREYEISFGSDYGCTYVTLGETKAVAQVTSELVEPRSVRPYEGKFSINLEIDDMVCANFETGHQEHLAVHANRLLQNCIKESGCIDLEALCVVSGEQVWHIRVDISVLNYDGNLHTCCSIAALAALSHFKTPHIELEDSKIKVQSVSNHEPQGLSLHHFPILLSYAIFDSEFNVVDPTEIEEKVSNAELVIGMNSYRELCGLHFRGKAISNRNLILSSSTNAANIASNVVKDIKDKLEVEAKKRKDGRGKTNGLCEAIHTDRILSASQDRSCVKTYDINKTVKDVSSMTIDEKVSDSVQDLISSDSKKGMVLKQVESTTLGKTWTPSENSTWKVIDVDSSSSSDDEVNYVRTITDKDRIIDHIELSGDSEEENVVVLEGKDVL